MADELETTIAPDTAAPATEAAPAAAAPSDARAPRARAGSRPGARPGGRPGSDRRGPRPPRAKSEFDSKMITIRRVSRVVAGGRRFSFSVAIIIGNKKGRVGVGLGKAGDTTLAIDKATRDAKKHMITLALTKDNSIPHEVSAKYNASRVVLMPARGRGLVAGSSVRPVLELAGISNIVAKVHSGSKNGLNNARAAIEALKTLKA
ncbi:MAG: 30S ribosomal protein S5 [Candidatus Pacebacteria bacterium]|nr:30S ribosomal protein S5 [Candidatus Paceibacterota bacterium]